MEAKTPKVLVVDDDAEIRDLLEQYLSQHGYEVNSVGSGNEMWQIFARDEPDIIILDVMLPGATGITLCRDLRTQSDVPIIMLTARGDELDRIIGLEMGADDYLPKPFNPRELLARMKVILRRSKANPKTYVPEKTAFIHFAGWHLDIYGRQLISPDKLVISLSSSEYRLLRIFLEHPNRVLSRDQLLDMLHIDHGDSFDRNIDVKISRLRQRLSEDAREPAIIKTVRQEGYMLSAAVTFKE